jgi:hypothetical protein
MKLKTSFSWSREKHGLFTARSAYNLALDIRENNPPNSSDNLSGDRNLWNTIWKTIVPPKVKIFIGDWQLTT